MRPLGPLVPRSYIDTPTLAVQVFDFDIAAGTISNGRVAFSIPQGVGFPDGMTMDADGSLWIAMWGGWQVLGFRPDGTCFARVKLPAVRGAVWPSACLHGRGSVVQPLRRTACPHSPNK